MSLGIAIKAPEGIVLAAESRLTLTATTPDTQIHVNFDNATKLLSFSEPNSYVGAITYGQAVIGRRTAQSFVPAFEAYLSALSTEQQRLSVSDFAQHLSQFYMQQWEAVVTTDYSGPDMSFIVGGYDDGAIYGRVFEIGIPRKLTPIEYQPAEEEFGITWGGQREIVDRLIQGVDSRLVDVLNSIQLTPQQLNAINQIMPQIGLAVPVDLLPLQDCIDLAIFFIRTTISAQQLTVGIRGVGGPIDVATITQRNGLQFVQRKTIHGEDRSLERS